MAVKTNLIKCQSCGAVQNVEAGRDEFFCTYCGARNIITNENEHIIRHIDDAEVKQAETEQLVRLKELELKEKEMAAKAKANKIRTIVLIIVGVIAVLLMVIGGVAGSVLGANDAGVMFLCIGWILLCCEFIYWMISKSINDNNKNKNSDES